MRSTSADFIINKNAETNKPVWLFEIEYTTGVSLYLAAYASNIVWDSKTFVSYQIRHQGLSENMEGQADSVSVQLGNADRYIQSFLESYDGLRGCKVTVHLIFADDLAAYSVISHVFYVDSSGANEQSVTLSLTSKIDLLQVQLPTVLFDRDTFPNVPGPFEVLL